MPKVLIFEEDEILFEYWMLDTEIILENADDEDFYHARIPQEGLEILATATDVKAVVVGLCADPDDFQYSKGELLQDIRKLSPEVPIIAVSDLEENRRQIFLLFGASDTTGREGVSAILAKLLQ